MPPRRRARSSTLTLTLPQPFGRSQRDPSVSVLAFKMSGAGFFGLRGILWDSSLLPSAVPVLTCFVFWDLKCKTAGKPAAPLLIQL